MPPMDNAGFREHPDDSRVLIVQDYNEVVPLMTDKGKAAHIVIVERPHLADPYKKLFNGKSGLFQEWQYASGAHSRHPLMDITLSGDKAAPIETVKVDHSDLTNTMKNVGLTETWTDLGILAGIVGGLTGRKNVMAMNWLQSAGQTIFNDEATAVWHWHGNEGADRQEVTAHTCFTDAGMDIVLNVTAHDTKGREQGWGIFKTVEIPDHAKIHHSTAAEIIVMKPQIIHRKSPASITTGRCAMAAYQAYPKGFDF